MIAALYVETDGAYYGLSEIDPWNEGRDARRYDGPYPVIAHPPCAKWSPLAYINRRRIPGYEIGDDGGCFEAALAAVRRFGGVLEHPASSLAWRTFGLERPRRGEWSPPDEHGGRVTEVDQGSYGHRARKRTWLYVVARGELPELNWAEAESTTIVSGFLHHAGTNEARRVRPREAAATPEPFRELLLSLARGAA